MAQAQDARLEKLIRASEAAGKVVVGAEVDGQLVRLTFADVVAEQSPADLINWKKAKK